MKITNYKYNAQTFEQEAYNKLQARTKADDKLKAEEQKLRKSPEKISLAYYKAYLDYMHTDNEHMGSFLAYIKHEFEMLKRTKPLFLNDDNMTAALDEKIVKCEEMFKFYSEMYDSLKNIEYELRESIESFESNKFKEDAMNLMTLHLILTKLDQSYLIIHTTAEEYRGLFGFKFVEECLALRNAGLKFDTYQQRAQKIVEENEDSKEA